MMRQFASSAGVRCCVQGTERHRTAGRGSRSHDQKDHRGRPKRRAQCDTVAGCRADWPKKAKKRNSWIKGEACPRGDRSARCDASLSAQILAGPEPDRDAFQQAQGLSAQGRRTNNSAPAPPDRQIRAYPHYPRSFQLFQACRLCVKSTGICLALVGDQR
jgi:hypothetical protein